MGNEPPASEQVYSVEAMNWYIEKTLKESTKDRDRIAKLEKENADLKEKINKLECKIEKIMETNNINLNNSQLYR